MSQIFPVPSFGEEKFQWRLLGFLVIATFTVLVYYPSLWHAPRSDQIVYFFVTSNRHTWASLAISCFDLNRWGTFAPGDERLFRPLVYFFLGTEKYLFGYNFWLWQAMGVFLHLTVIWYLMKLLWRIVPGLVAFACTLFFAMLLTNMEMVIWTHVNSYLVFVLTLMIALDQVYVCIKAGSGDQTKRMIGIALCFLIGGFVYETANIFAILAAIVLIKKRSSWIILVPPTLFFIFDVMNLRAHQIALPMKGPDFLQGCTNVLVSWGFWIYSALGPGLVRMYFDARNMIRDDSFVWSYVVVGVIAAMTAVVLGCRRLKLAQRNFIFLMVSMMFFYSLAIVMGRGENHPVSWVLTRNTHYFYPYWALMMIVAGILISAVNNQRVQIALAGVLVILAIINGIRLYQINMIQEEGSRGKILLVRSVESLIEEKKNEKDFSFYVSPDYPGNYAYSDAYGRKSSFIGMLFPRYYKENMAKYTYLPANSNFKMTY